MYVVPMSLYSSLVFLLLVYYLYFLAAITGKKIYRNIKYVNSNTHVFSVEDGKVEEC